MQSFLLKTNQTTCLHHSMQFNLCDFIVPACNISQPWDPPSAWTRLNPVAYRSFDCPDGLIMMEGTQQANLTFIAGKVHIILIHTNYWSDCGLMMMAGKLCLHC